MERIAHRGAKRELPENTLPAFIRAFERGADAIELDVHGTADGVVVVHHDPWIGGSPLSAPRIADLDLSEIARFDLGGGVRVPTLAEVLEATPRYATVYVEVKGVGIEEAVAAVITAGHPRCAVHSFDHAAIARLHDIAPEIPRGILFDTPDVNLGRALELAAARDVWPRWDLIDSALVDRVHDAGCRVIAWTVNSRPEALRLQALGVDGVCGDDVRLFPAP